MYFVIRNADGSIFRALEYTEPLQAPVVVGLVRGGRTLEIASADDLEVAAWQKAQADAEAEAARVAQEQEAARLAAEAEAQAAEAEAERVAQEAAAAVEEAKRADREALLSRVSGAKSPEDTAALLAEMATRLLTLEGK